MLPSLVNSYNSTKHHTIKMTPIEASKKEYGYTLKPLFQEKQINYREAKYKIGDKFIISKYKTVFEKVYAPKIALISV